MFLPGVTNESDTMLGTLGDELDGLRRSAGGLTAGQSRERTTRSQLTIGGIVKHVTFGLRTWATRFEAAPDPSQADRETDARVQEWVDSFALTDGETLEGALAEFDAARERLFAVIRRSDLDARAYHPAQPWFGLDATSVSIRWGVAHCLGEVAHHAGHADIIREQLDGATTESLMGVSWEPPSPL